MRSYIWLRVRLRWFLLAFASGLLPPPSGMQPSVGLLFTLVLSFCLNVDAGAHLRRDNVSLQNGEDAVALKYAHLTPPPAIQVDGR